MAENPGKIHTLVLALILIGLGGLLVALTWIDAEDGEPPTEVDVAAPAYVEESAPTVVAPLTPVVRQSAGGVTELAVEVLDPEGSPNLRARIGATGPGGVTLSPKLAPNSWKELLPGEWTVSVTADDYLPEQRTLEVKAGVRSTVAITQRHGVRIRGRIANVGGEAAPGLTVWFLREGQDEPSRAKGSKDGGVYASATSKADGLFESPLLEPGMVRVYAANAERTARPFESTQFLKAKEDREVDIVLPGGGKVDVEILGYSPRENRERPTVTLLRKTGTDDEDAQRRRRSRPAAWVPMRWVPLSDDGRATFSNAEPGKEYKVQLQVLRMIYTSETTFQFRRSKAYHVTATMPTIVPSTAPTKEQRVEQRAERQAMPPPLQIQVQEGVIETSTPGIHWR